MPPTSATATRTSTTVGPIFAGTTSTSTRTSTSTTTRTTTTVGTSSLLSTLIQSTTGPNTISTDGRTVGSTVVTSASFTSMVSGTSIPIMTGITTTTAVTDSSTSATGMFNCQTSYIGTHCNISSDACAMSQPCQNAATCFPNNTLPSGYYCACRTGYAGYDCQWDIRACREDTCW